MRKAVPNTKPYTEFQFLRNWQRLIMIGIFLVLIQIFRVTILNPNNLWFSLGIAGISLTLGIFTIVFGNRKIIMSENFISFENQFLGFKQQNFNLNQIYIKKKQWGFFTIFKLTTKNQSIKILPLFWGNKNKVKIENLLNVLSNNEI